MKLCGPRWPRHHVRSPRQTKETLEGSYRVDRSICLEVSPWLLHHILESQNVLSMSCLVRSLEARRPDLFVPLSIQLISCPVASLRHACQLMSLFIGRWCNSYSPVDSLAIALIQRYTNTYFFPSADIVSLSLTAILCGSYV